MGGSPWVASLVGLNLLRGHARGGLICPALGSGGTLVAATSVRDGEVFAAVHPRAVALYRDRPDPSPRNVWAGAITGMDALGSRVRVHVGGLIPIVAEVMPAAVAALGLAAGGDVWVA
ncbi:MAG: TOBE domain-containing protein [Egibacteraceae bacterium]